MGETRERIVALLRDELRRYQDEVAEITLLLEVLVEPGVETGAEDYGMADREEQPDRAGGRTLPVDETLLVTRPLPVDGDTATTGGGLMQDIQAENRAAILRILSYDGKATANHISGVTGIPRGTVRSHLKAMHDDGRLGRELGRSEVGGRRPYLYSLVPVVEPREHRLDLKTRIVEE